MKGMLERCFDIFIPYSAEDYVHRLNKICISTNRSDQFDDTIIDTHIHTHGTI